MIGSVIRDEHAVTNFCHDKHDKSNAPHKKKVHVSCGDHEFGLNMNN